MELFVNKIKVEKRKMKDENTDLDYWLSRTSDERLSAVELIRQNLYGYLNDNPPRLQRIVTIVRRKRS